MCLRSLTRVLTQLLLCVCGWLLLYERIWRLPKKDKKTWATSGQGYVLAQIFKAITTARRQVTMKGIKYTIERVDRRVIMNIVDRAGIRFIETSNCCRRTQFCERQLSNGQWRLLDDGQLRLRMAWGGGWLLLRFERYGKLLVICSVLQQCWRFTTNKEVIHSLSHLMQFHNG